MSASKRSITQQNCLPARNELLAPVAQTGDRLGAGVERPSGRLGAVGIAVALHVAGFAALYNFGVNPPSPSSDEQPVEMVTLAPPAPEAPAQPDVTQPVSQPPPPDAAAIVTQQQSDAPAEAALEMAATEPTEPAPVAPDQPPQVTQSAPAVAPPTTFRPVVSAPPAKPLRHIAQATQKVPAQQTTDAPPVTSPVKAEAVAASSNAVATVSAAPSADAEARLEARIRDAVQAAVTYPSAARMMGLTGRARVLLDYQSGSVDKPILAQSSGTPMLDSAALAAARDAHYPKPPPDLAGQRLRLLVWVEFRTG
jgi:protein TonB